jgi:hypothetical protein
VQFLPRRSSQQFRAFLVVVIIIIIIIVVVGACAGRRGRMNFFVARARDRAFDGSTLLLASNPRKLVSHRHFASQPSDHLVGGGAQ